VAASEGSVSDAVALARQAAVLAASQDQHAVEAVALHTAVCFGDRTVAERLAKLATQVDGPFADPPQHSDYPLEVLLAIRVAA
jgi:hypothetical protein